MSGSPLQLSAPDKLDVLRYLDEFHYWHSLDDERRCKGCRRVITGQQILVFELDGTHGKLRLQCPTVACISTPSDWVYADPILAARLGTPPSPGPRIAVAKNTSDTRTPHAGHRPPRSGVAVGASSAENSWRTAIGSLVFLRPFTTRLHAIHPVA